METPNRFTHHWTEKPAPVDLSHHYSAVTKRRTASKIKEAYKFFQIPGILNIAGGSYQFQLLWVIIRR